MPQHDAEVRAADRRLVGGIRGAAIERHPRGSMQKEVLWSGDLFGERTN
jgi:hypothetical protein